MNLNRSTADNEAHGPWVQGRRGTGPIAPL